MNARGLTTAALAGIAGTLMMALAGCGPSGHSAAVKSPSVGSASPAPTAAASRPATPALTPAPSGTQAPMATPTPSASADTSIEVYGNCTSPSFEPAVIVVACADYGWIVQDLVWTSWTSTSATATGTLVYNDCTPSCAAGHHHAVPGTRVILTDPRASASGQLVWTRLQETRENYGAPVPLPIRPI
jgi:hypothetical protein